MRNLTDGEGQEWDVTPGRESWGGLVLLFVPRAGGEVRTAPLAAETPLEAQRELADFSDEQLRAMLADSQPWG